MNGKRRKIAHDQEYAELCTRILSNRQYAELFTLSLCVKIRTLMRKNTRSLVSLRDRLPLSISRFLLINQQYAEPCFSFGRNYANPYEKKYKKSRASA